MKSHNFSILLTIVFMSIHIQMTESFEILLIHIVLQFPFGDKLNTISVL